MLRAWREQSKIVVRNDGPGRARDVQVVPSSMSHPILDPGEECRLDDSPDAHVVKYVTSLDEVVDVPIA